MCSSDLADTQELDAGRAEDRRHAVTEDREGLDGIGGVVLAEVVDELLDAHGVDLRQLAGLQAGAGQREGRRVDVEGEGREMIDPGVDEGVRAVDSPKLLLAEARVANTRRRDDEGLLREAIEGQVGVETVEVNEGAQEAKIGRASCRERV